MNKGVRQHYAAWFTSSTAQRYGAAVQAFAVTLIAYSLTGSTVTAGALGTVRGIIATLIVVPGGAVVDRFDRRALMLGRGSLNVIAWGAGTLLYLLGLLDGVTGISIFIALVVADALIEGIFGGAAEAALRSLLDASAYVRARAVNEGRDASAQLLGSPISGALFSLWPFAPIVFGVVADLVSAVAALRLPRLGPGTTPESLASEGSAALDPDNEIESEDQAEAREDVTSSGIVDEAVSVMRGSLAGFGWIARGGVVVSLTLIAALASLGGFLYMSLLQLHLIASGVPAFRVGLIATAEGVGVLLGSSIAAVIATRVRTGFIVIGSLAWSLLCFVPVIIWADSYWVMLAMTFLYALFVPAINAAFGGYVFQLVPPDLQGRVGAASTLVVGLPVAGASLIAGVVLKSAGLQIGLVIAIVLTGLAILVALVDQRVRTIPTPDRW